MGGSDVFIHQKQMGAFQTGSLESFAVVLSQDNKPQAYDLVSTDALSGAILGASAAPPDQTSILCDGKGKGGCNGGGKGKAEEIEIGKFIGTIKSFNNQSGYGFLHCQDLVQRGYTSDVFLHQMHLGGFQAGATVHFTAFVNSKGQPQAKDLSAAG